MPKLLVPYDGSVSSYRAIQPRYSTRQATPIQDPPLGGSDRRGLTNSGFRCTRCYAEWPLPTKSRTGKLGSAVHVRGFGNLTFDATLAPRSIHCRVPAARSRRAAGSNGRVAAGKATTTSNTNASSLDGRRPSSADP